MSLAESVVPLVPIVPNCDQQSNQTGLPFIPDNPFTVFSSSPTRPVVNSISAYPSDLTESASSPHSPWLVVPLFDNSNHRTNHPSSPSRNTSKKHNSGLPSETERFRTDYQIALERLENANLQTQMLSSFKREFVDSFMAVRQSSFGPGRFVPSSSVASPFAIADGRAAIVGTSSLTSRFPLPLSGFPHRSDCWDCESASLHLDCIHTASQCHAPVSLHFPHFLIFRRLPFFIFSVF